MASGSLFVKPPFCRMGVLWVSLRGEPVFQLVCWFSLNTSTPPICRVGVMGVNLVWVSESEPLSGFRASSKRVFQLKTSKEGGGYPTPKLGCCWETCFPFLLSVV